jgi:hypothetical protein
MRGNTEVERIVVTLIAVRFGIVALIVIPCASVHRAQEDKIVLAQIE